jgi:uncharacterized protein with PIN domain
MNLDKNADVNKRMQKVRSTRSERKRCIDCNKKLVLTEPKTFRTCSECLAIRRIRKRL